MDDPKAHLAILTSALAEGRSGEVMLGLLHAIARLYQFVETTHEQPDLAIALLDQELSIMHGQNAPPGTRATVEVLRSILESSFRKPN